ncbi:MAG: ATP-dependent DNA helicase UvrD2 [Acidimicrobiia bacterium]
MIDSSHTGRSVVVTPGQAPPPAWRDFDRVEVNAVDRALADQLCEAWRTRRPLIISLAPGLGLDDAPSPPSEAIMGVQPWQLSVDHDFVGERLHHAIWSNAVDGRVENLPYVWVERAVGLGARPTSGADALLHDGTEVVCDGGPIDIELPVRLGVPVIHRISLEHGSLTPLGVNHSRAVLAPDQLAAVTHPGGGARIIAPAGSGKTRVLTERARVLVEVWKLPPDALAVVAFNRKAAEELKNRTSDLPGLRVRTLNALGLRLIQNIRTIEEPEVRDHLAGLVDLPRKAETDPAAPWIEALGRVRLGLQHPDEVVEDLPDVVGLDEVVVRYRALLRDLHAADFDEQVLGAIERLLADAEFRHRAQRYARLILVDEFQDLTPAHLLLFRLLAGPAGAVFAVGDDDQTIYGYAGATPEWLVRFADFFPGSASYALEVNYRCPAPVVKAAVNVLTRNGLRVSKQIRPGPDAATSADALVVSTDTEPALFRTAKHVADRLLFASPGDVAVLSRVHSSLAPVQVVLRHHGIPTNRVVDQRFLARAAVGAALAWLSLATTAEGSFTSTHLRHAARRPKRGMGKPLLDLVGRQRSLIELDRLATWLAGKRSDRESIKVIELAADIAAVRKIAAGGTTRQVLDEIRHHVGVAGLEASATSLDSWSHGAAGSHRDDLEALAALAYLQPDPAAFGPWVVEALSGGHDPHGVTLASIHAVKGREWPHVIIHDATAGLMPHRLVGDIEEERRVFHVGITRCRESVTVVAGEPPSQFLAEMLVAGHPLPRRPEADRALSTGPNRRPLAGTGPTDPVAAAVGLCFDQGGYLHEVVAIGGEGALTRVGENAEFTVAWGTPVRVLGVPRSLAHPDHEAVFERLRSWRTTRAGGKPAYTVLTDESLRLISISLPADERSLAAVKGIGPAKLDRFGNELLGLLAQITS